MANKRSDNEFTVDTFKIKSCVDRNAPTFMQRFVFTVSDNDEKSTKWDSLQSFGPWIQAKVKSSCRKKIMHKRLPIFAWLPTYSAEDAVGDLVAGITVGLTVIPQALAYAGIAGLAPAVSFLLNRVYIVSSCYNRFRDCFQFGLYGSFLGCFVYIILGSCKDVPMGPTAIASLLTFQAAGGVWQRAVLLSFLTGAIELLMGALGLGFLINFVSGPVSSGFTSAVALIILTSQIKDVFGEFILDFASVASIQEHICCGIEQESRRKVQHLWNSGHRYCQTFISCNGPIRAWAFRALWFCCWWGWVSTK